MADLLEHGCKSQFEWDENKNQLNQQKHGIGFEEAKEIFLGNVFTSISEKIDYGEIREVRIGAIWQVLIVSVMPTDRSGLV